MKRVLLIILSALMLTGCIPEEAAQQVVVAEASAERFAGMDGEITIVTDTETGCKYLRELKHKNSTMQTLGLTVLLKADGTPDCSKK